MTVTPQHSQGSRQLTGAVAILASAGGIPALLSLLGSLPGAFPLPILVAQHLAPFGSILPTVLSWHSSQSVSWAAEGEQPVGGRIYLVPPRMRLAVTASGFELSPLSPIASSWLACGDHLMKSLVTVYGSRSVGVVLSGMLPAGVDGMRAIKTCGGVTMAQNQMSSDWFDMPAAAIDWGKAEIVMPPERMALVLTIIAEQWRREEPMLAAENG